MESAALSAFEPSSVAKQPPRRCQGKLPQVGLLVTQLAQLTKLCASPTLG
jgi:hypothetical protein